jgi:phosphoribosylanthranilate isomerase
MERRVRVQIYTAQTPEEARALAAVGADHVGLTPSEEGLPGEVDTTTARSMRDALVGVARSVALSVSSDRRTVLEMATSVRPDILHLCGPPGALGPDEVEDLRRDLGDIEVMQAIAVTGPDAVQTALAFAPIVDYLILDSVAPDIPGIGAAGEVHDWAVSAEIVARVDVPVILAGGLSPENVADAVVRVRPWGVDSLTHTNRPAMSGGFSKDLDLVEAFVSAARGAGRT